MKNRTAILVFFALFPPLFGQMGWYCATDSADWLPRVSFASVVHDSKMWILGGDSDRERFNDVWYSTDGINWTCATNSAAWSPRCGHVSLVYNNKIWVMGGVDSSSSFKNDVWYSTDGINWTCATNSAAWSPRYKFATLTYDNKMWIMGGKNTFFFFKDVWFSTDGVNWSCATNSAEWGGYEGRFSFPCVSYDNRMWIAGGYCNGTPMNDVWYSFNGSHWLRATSSAAWSPRYGHVSLVYNNKIWVMGGVDTTYSFMNDVWYSTGLGIEETQTLTQPASLTPTIIHSSQFFQQLIKQPSVLLNISGRKIADLKPGANNIRHLKSGIYFLLPQIVDKKHRQQKIVLIN